MSDDTDDIISRDDGYAEYRPVPPVPSREEVYELFRLRKENEQLHQEIVRLTQLLDKVTQERDGLWNIAMHTKSEG